MRPCEIWIEQCEATRQIEAEFGTQNALDYLIGEKFLNFLQAAEEMLTSGLRSLPSSVGSRRSSRPGNWLSIWRRHVSRSHSIPASTTMRGRGYTTPNSSKMNGRMSFAVPLADLLLVEQARGWLLGEDD